MSRAHKTTARSRRQAGERGQAMAEFALCLPLLVMILFAVFQFGIIFVNYIEVSSAAREGARNAAVNGSPSGVNAAAQGAAAVAGTLGVAVSAPSGWDSGDKVTVTVTYPWSLGIPGLAAQTGTLTSVITARVE
jgi:Flp pilus assembly protein TadG